MNCTKPPPAATAGRLAGPRTASGKPLLAGDSHRALDTPNVYYQCHLACPDFDVVGLAIPGVPGFPHFGHNDRVAWCITHTSADYQDLYIERFQSDNPQYYLNQGQWRRAEVFQETIQVRGGDPVDLTLYVTQHGPVIAGGPGIQGGRDGIADRPGFPLHRHGRRQALARPAAGDADRQRRL